MNDRLPMFLVLAVAADLCSQGGSAVLYQVGDAHGTVELLVNNAGVENAGLIWELGADRWNKVMDINVSGVFYGLRSFVPRMIQARPEPLPSRPRATDTPRPLDRRLPHLPPRHTNIQCQ